MLHTKATFSWKRELNYPRKQRSINQSNNINVPATEYASVFIAQSPALFTPVVLYESCPQRAFMHNIHTEFPRFAYGSTGLVVREGWVWWGESGKS
jgi:hypothetical protein